MDRGRCAALSDARRARARCVTLLLLAPAGKRSPSAPAKTPCGESRSWHRRWGSGQAARRLATRRRWGWTPKAGLTAAMTLATGPATRTRARSEGGRVGRDDGDEDRMSVLYIRERARAGARERSVQVRVFWFTCSPPPGCLLGKRPRQAVLGSRLLVIPASRRFGKVGFGSGNSSGHIHTSISKH